MENTLCNRLFDFAVAVLTYLPDLPHTPEFKVIRYQLAKAASSAGANYEESQAGSSRRDFNNKSRIALREMREAHYWLRLLNAIEKKSQHKPELDWLLDEANQLKKILGKIVSKTND